MKKILLMSAVATVVSFNAEAQIYNSDNWVRPFVGADYVYSHAKVGDFASDAKKDYNSWVLNAGMDVAPHMFVEAFYQQSGEKKSQIEDEKLKSEFNAWGMDFYGRKQINCSSFNMLASLGLADYNAKFKYAGFKRDKERVGYRGGVGFSYDFTNNVSMRVMGRYTYIGMNDLDNLMEVTAGLRYTF